MNDEWGGLGGPIFTHMNGAMNVQWPLTIVGLERERTVKSGTWTCYNKMTEQGPDLETFNIKHYRDFGNYEERNGQSE
jgi:hypothetical protein